MPVVLLLSFVTGFVVMLVEVLAPRIVAPTLGATHLTWAVVLGVFLGALALGNVLGGRLADRRGRWATPIAFVTALLAIAAVPWLVNAVSAGAANFESNFVRALIVVAIPFAPSGVALGLVGPSLARSALARARTPGRGLGAVAAAGALGSVVGTLMTGFVGLAHFTTTELLGVGVGLCAFGALISPLVPSAMLTARGSTSSIGRWTWTMAFVGAALLILEVVAGRVVAQRLGSSLDSWTAVLATVLLALGLGNLVGGRLADKADPRVQVGRWLTFGSALVASTLWTPRVLTAMANTNASWPFVVFGATLLAFGAPAFAFGVLHPLIVRAALKDPATDGEVAGRLYASGTLGAVVGALLAGTVLVPLLGLPLLVIVLAFVMAVVAGRMLQRYEVVWLATLLLVGFVAWSPIESVARAGRTVGLREDHPNRHVADSPYFRLVVEPHEERWARASDFDALRAQWPLPAFANRMRIDASSGRVVWQGPMQAEEAEGLAALLGRANADLAPTLRKRTQSRMRRLTLDGFVHGFVDLDDPTWLEYDYEVLYDALVRSLRPQRRLACFFIGGGCFTLQRHLLRDRNSLAKFVTAEIDPAVTEMATTYLGLTEDPRHTIIHDDARVALAKSPDTFDFIFGDAFHDLGVPWHLTTQEFAASVRVHLKPTGLYMVNLIDVWSSGQFLRAFLDTLETEFDHVRVLSMAPRDDKRQETFLLVASAAPFEWDRLVDANGRTLAVTQYNSADIAELRKRTNALVLRDDYAPVEHLLLPVVRRRGSVRARR